VGRRLKYSLGGFAAGVLLALTVSLIFDMPPRWTGPFAVFLGNTSGMLLVGWAERKSKVATGAALARPITLFRAEDPKA
jgi:hypothetical protein